MGGESDKLGFPVSWKSLLISFGGSTLLALIDMFISSGFVLYFAMLVGVFSAASVFKYKCSDSENKFAHMLVFTVILCVLGSIWAGLFRHGVCLFLCMMEDVSICKYCSVVFMRSLIVVGGGLSTLMGVLFSLTLGRQSLSCEL